jgi:arginine deiminase
MHNLLTETVAIPEGKKWILDNAGHRQPGRPRPRQRNRSYLRRPFPAHLAEFLIGGVSADELPEANGKGTIEHRSAISRPAGTSNICCAACPTPSTRATPPAGFTAA